MLNKLQNLKRKIIVITISKLNKTLYDLKQAPRASYDMLTLFLVENDFHKGK